ncbi:ectoine/hydroxyectoine ABC transporter substrate-binding protein EhuB [Pigmentiphaga sp. NML080357]|uniref:ectoine/hydroxyectoine ABC transporter substrate-binding protein EhuB n=1 Tax=Pigmentiphaga sp. NML080357 TaxID=2008675 RepID=UPI000B41F5AF|nr:ectoine/hydroxyectoine ABC transporter substrate-binding protein EhuB [Pigmentiphaga sp. NML080357]OVZ54076.1 ectoine/hydroxyectoine ABC transporter substrate-binding protein EhuB [Pigmentiphaga sp. NML080357]
MTRFFLATWTAVWLAAVAPRAGAAGAAPDAAAPADGLQRAIQAGKIRIGYANEAPFAFMDSRAGRLTGEAPEIARVVLGRLGIPEVEGVLTEFGALIPGLQAGRFDIIAAGMYVLPDRCRQIAFSNPTYGVGDGFLQRTDNARQLHGYADVAADPSARVGVVVGAVQNDYAARAGVPPSQVVVFPDVVSAVEGVVAGRADVYAATALTLNYVLTKVPDWQIDKVAKFVQPTENGVPVRGYGAFGFRQGDVALREAFDRELAHFIGTPEHLRLVQPFGFTERELPGAVTAARLCGQEAAAVPEPS